MEYFYNVPKIIDELSIFQIGIRMLVAVMLAGVAAYSYQVSHNRKSYSALTMISGLICAVIVTMVLMAIDSNLPRAFGLFAALSLIRFRMPVKDIRDIVYLFFCLAIGISCGAGALTVAITSTLFICAITCVAYYYYMGFRQRSRFSISTAFNAKNNSIEDINATLKECANNVKMIEMSGDMGQACRALFSVELKGKKKIDAVMQKLQSMPDMNQVKIVSVVNENEMEGFEPASL